METTTLHIKVSEVAYAAFGDKARSLDKKPSDLIREMIDAVNDDRLTIQPTTGQMRLFGIDKEYNND